jgi:hypothetical protein
MIADTVPAEVEVVYSNIGKEWIAELVDDGGKTLAFSRGSTRADVLRGLADAIEG